MRNSVGRKIVLEHPAYRKLISAAEQLDRATNEPEVTAMMVQNAKALVRDAIDVLMEKDPLKQKLGVISLMILEATSWKLEKVNGKIVEIAEVTNDYLFAWAVRELHQLPTKYQ